jgi:hypothetical protein
MWYIFIFLKNCIILYLPSASKRLNAELVEGDVLLPQFPNICRFLLSSTSTIHLIKKIKITLFFNRTNDQS